jgi:hypothetical protein
MKPLAFAAVAGSLVACALPLGDDPASESDSTIHLSPASDLTLRGRVIGGEGKKTVEASLDVAVFWLHYNVEGDQRYAPMKVASAEGELPVDFSGALPDAPSADQVRAIHDPKTDFVPDPDAVIGLGMLYVTTDGALEENPEGVEALDVGVVLGMVRDVRLFFTSVDLETTDGLEPFPSELIDDQSLAAGYHLFFGPDEVDLATPVEAELGYVAD